ncbi:MAG: YdcF family protein [Myxococcaceae bacterium]
MFFVLSKLLDVIVDPFWWAFVPTVAGVVLLVRGQRRRLALGSIAFGLGALFLFALPAVSNRLWSSLEADAPNTVRPGVKYDAVVLLGGVVSPPGSLNDDPAWNDNIERLLAVRQLLVEDRAKVAIVSGGALAPGLRTEAEYLREELVKLGVDSERVLIEDQANNTRENATLTRPLLERLGAREVLIVTSAFHARRALGCFTAAGLAVDVWPVDYRLRDLSRDPHLVPRGDYFTTSSRALREWLGRLVYRVMGYTKG